LPSAATAASAPSAALSPDACRAITPLGSLKIIIIIVHRRFYKQEKEWVVCYR
jgi:hypothetical protein